MCRCCCDTDGCNEEDGFCFETPRCPKLNLKRPLMVTCDNFKVKQNDIGSQCSFSCPENFFMAGRQKTTCRLTKIGALWSEKPPRCVPLCPKEDHSKYLSVDCTKENRIKSVCRATCPEGYILRGPEERKCKKFKFGPAKWSNKFGICEPMCSELPIYDNGYLTCSKSNFLGSKCQLFCNSGFERSSETKLEVITCEEEQSKAVWLNTKSLSHGGVSLPESEVPDY